MLGVKIGNLDPLAVKMLTVKKKKLSHETEDFYWGSRTRLCKQLRRCYQLAVCSVCAPGAVYCFFGSDKIRKLNKNTKYKKGKSKSKSAVFSVYENERRKAEMTISILLCKVVKIKRKTKMKKRSKFPILVAWVGIVQ